MADLLLSIGLWLILFLSLIKPCHIETYLQLDYS